MGNTFVIAVATVSIGTVCGVIVGAFTGYFGGLLDEVLMRVNDVVFAFPSIPAGAGFCQYFWHRQIQCDRCAGHCIHTEFCPHRQRRIYQIQRDGLCEECKACRCGAASHDLLCIFCPMPCRC